MTYLATQAINPSISSFSSNKINSNAISTKFVVAIYIRVSLPKQGTKNKVSLKIQKKQAIEYAEAMKWRIYEVYTDKVSGYLKYQNRPGGGELVEAARKGLFNLVLLWDSDRNGRDPEALAAKLFRHDMRILGVQVTSLDNPIVLVDPNEYKLEPYNEGQILTESVQDLISAANVSKFRRKSMEAKREKAQQGKMLTTPPYGYRLEPIRDKQGRIMITEDKRIVYKRVVDENERQYVIRVYDEYVFKGLSMCEIRDGLNRDGITTRKGGHWELAMVARILKNSVYFGQVIYGKHYRRKNALDNSSRWGLNPKGKWIIVEPENTQHEAIISKNVFDKAQEIRLAKLKLGAVCTYNSYLFSGILRCAICGSIMYSRKFLSKYKRKTDGMWTKSWCTGYVCGRWSRFKDTDKNYIGESRILEILMGDLSKYKNNPEVLKGYLKTKENTFINDNNNKLVAAQKRLLRLTARAKRLIKLYGDNKISRKELDEVRVEDDDNARRLIEHIQVLERNISDNKRMKDRRINFKNSIVKFEEIFNSGDVRQKKMFIRSLIDNIQIKKGKIIINYAV